ncbi:Phosphatidylcholine:ceramide cholinephosphotransferase 3 [Pelomyxa schiedti]|nr:Phosphatidylcholine:ceramide cholinephosphotransferase 3 [Pelomyxa schiedti]
MTVTCGCSALTRQHILSRLKGELWLLKAHWKYVAFAVFWFAYVISMVARNFVFYFHEVGRPLLSDRGFTLLPNMEESEIVRIVADTPIKVVGGLIGVMAIWTLFGNTTSTTKPYMYNILERMGSVFLLGQTLRFFTYSATSLPGVSVICRSDAAAEYQPQTWIEVFFTRFAVSPNSNCGDLVFSGHIFTLLTFIFTFQRYSLSVFTKPSPDPAAPHTRAQTYLKVFNYSLFTLIPLQLICILLTRRHYTVDVVASCYISPLIWNWYCTKWPGDDKPPQAFVILAEVGDPPPGSVALTTLDHSSSPTATTDPEQNV